MRIETPYLPQSTVESPKAIEKKDFTKSVPTGPDGEEQSFVPSPLGSGGTYSISSLRAAVDYYAKFLTVAEDNIQAANHPPKIPQIILDRLKGQ